MEVSVRLELSALVEEMTHSGAPSLDEIQLKKLKKICKLGLQSLIVAIKQRA